MFRAAPGHMIFEADYSQAEVRWWAQISGDTEYAAVFERMRSLRLDHYAHPENEELAKKVITECDVHRQVASLMFRVALEEVTKHQRQAAKNITFGSIYGQTCMALARALGIEESEAEELQKKFLYKFKHAAQWLFDIEAFAEKHLYVDNAFGRRRHLDEEFNSGIKGIINRGKRQARNSPIQGSSSDMMVFSGCYVQDYVMENDKPWKLENLVHDAMLIEVPMDLDVLTDAVRSVERMMVDMEPLKEVWGINMIVPMEVEVKAGIRWGHCTTWDSKHTLEDILLDCKKQAIAEGQRLVA